MNAQISELLAELESQGRENDAREAERSRKMLNLQPKTARLVSILARSTKATRVLEIGTSNGYSTIWLAAAVAPAGGRVTSIDRNPDKHALARENLRGAGLLDRVDLLLGDATEVVSRLKGPFDLVFFDADRTSAPEQLRLLLPKLAPEVLLLADNALSHPEEIAAYLAAIDGLEHCEHTVVPVGKGLSIAYRGRA
jgi:predicted O-methyltransferase YrrM